MTARQSSAVDKALRAVRAGLSLTEAARRHGVALSSVRRAMRRAGEPPRKPGPKPKVSP